MLLLYEMVNINIMVFEENTLKILHPLTEEGKIRYQKYLEQKADEILFKNEHPLIYLYKQIKDWFKHD